MAPQVQPRTALQPRSPTWAGLRNGVMRAFAQRGILGWGSNAWPGGEGRSLRQPIERMVPGDPERAQEMYAARFGRNPGDTLGQLGWLKHFASSGKALHALYAIELIRKWAAGEMRTLKGAAAAKALLALVTDGHQFASKGPKAFATDYLAIITDLTRRIYAWTPDRADDSLLRATGLAYALTANFGFEQLRPRVKDAFEAAISQSILPDGGTHDGKPETLLRLLLQLLPLRQAMAATHEPIPASLNGALERMLPMLRMLQHGNRDIAHLRGTQSHAEIAAIILDYDDIQGAPLDLARHSGFARIDTPLTTTIIDTTPLGGFGCEISVDGEPVIGSWQNADIAIRASGTESPAELLDMGEGMMLIAGFRHRTTSFSRHMFVTADGSDIRVEDSAEDCGNAFSISVALHPGVTCSISSDEATLSLRNGQEWRLRLRGGNMHKSPGSDTLVMIAVPDAGRCAITWALQKQE
jgi:hypothetical protein